MVANEKQETYSGVDVAGNSEDSDEIVEYGRVGTEIAQKDETAHDVEAGFDHRFIGQLCHGNVAVGTVKPRVR